MKGWIKVVLLIIPYIFIVGAFQYLGGRIMNFNILNEGIRESSVQQLFISLFDLIGTFLLLFFFMKFIDKQKFVLLGFQLKNRLVECSLGIIAGFIIMLLSYLFLIYTEEIFFQKRYLISQNSPFPFYYLESLPW